MSELTIEIQGLDEALQKLETIGRADYLPAVMQAAASDLMGWLAVYPPASSANDSSEDRWYERGFGPRWRRKDGSIGGRQTSETLGRRWTTQVAPDGLWARVGNNASYARFVQGIEQAWFHAKRGWRTTVQAVQERGPEIVAKVQAAIEAIWRQ